MFYDLQFVNKSQMPPEIILENDVVSFSPTLTAFPPVFRLFLSFTLIVSAEKKKHNRN